MRPEETIVITRLVAATCPQQHMDEYTPDAWHPLLDDLNFADARQAVTNLGRRQAFISPADIRAEVRRIHADRLDRAGELDPPAADPNDPRAYNDAVLARRRRIASGHPDPRALPPSPEQRAARDTDPVTQPVGKQAALTVAAIHRAAATREDHRS